MKPNISELAERIHKNNHQWWHDLHTGERLRRNKGELLMLVITELSEAVEGIRKGLMDDHLPSRKMEEVEMADAMIRLLDIKAGFKIADFCIYEFNVPSTYPQNKAEHILDICRSVCYAYESTDLSYAVSGIIQYCELYNLDLWGAVEEKIEYNLNRADHKKDARLANGGKKF